MSGFASIIRRNREWRKLWLGQGISIVGDYVFDTTVVLWVGTSIGRGQSWAPAAVSGVLIAAAVPALLVGPVAGVFVDRWNRKRIMMFADLIRALIIGLLALIPILGLVIPVWAQLCAVYASVAATAAVSQFFNPARFAAIASVVSRDDRAQAFSLASATSSIAAVLGPPLGAPLLFSVGVKWALLVNVVSFVVSYLFIRSTAIPDEAARRTGDAPAGFVQEFREGWQFLRRNMVLRTVAVVIVLYMFGIGAVNVLEVFFVSENLHVSPGWLGTLNGALGVGSIIGALICARFAKRYGDARVFAWGIVLTGVLAMMYSRTSMLAVAVVVLGLIGVPLAAVNVVLGPIILGETPERLLGRINAVVNPLVYLASVFSMAVAGLAASSLGTGFRWHLGIVHGGRIDLIFFGSSLLMVGSGLVAVARLARRAGPPPEPAPVSAQLLDDQ